MAKARIMGDDDDEIVLTFSRKSINNAIKKLRQEQKYIDEHIDMFLEELAKRGVEIAKDQITTLGAIDDGELLNSMSMRKGDAVQNGSVWYIYTACEHAPFVEFGTGIAGVWGGDHPNASAIGWQHDTHDHGYEGWNYIGDDNRKHWTLGMPYRPFMYNTTLELNKIITDVAKEVFGE